MKLRASLIVISFLFLNAMTANAACGLYTYQDIFADDAGNAIGDNYTQATCLQPNAYADSYVQMPSGWQNAASSTGANTAEALSQAEYSTENGTGTFWGYNEASSACWAMITSSTFSLGISIKTTYGANTLGSQVVLDTRFCNYTPACSNGVTPACGSPSFTRSIHPASTQCGYYVRTTFLRAFGVCYGFNHDADGPGPCDP